MIEAISFHKSFESINAFYNKINNYIKKYNIKRDDILEYKTKYKSNWDNNSDEILVIMT